MTYVMVVRECKQKTLKMTLKWSNILHFPPEPIFYDCQTSLFSFSQKPFSLRFKEDLGAAGELGGQAVLGEVYLKTWPH